MPNIEDPVSETLPPFAEVVRNVQNYSPEGLEQLYRVFRMLTLPLRRQFGFQDFEDRLHDIFLVVVDSIRDGKLREPGALPSYIQGIARITLCSTLGVRSRHRRLSGTLAHWVNSNGNRLSPEETLSQKERLQVMRQLLASLSDREREILTRFYLREQTKDQICDELHLTETQFRLAKSRAKQRLTRLGSEHLSPITEETPAAA
jgi:RNA polymerase sigma-70 factor (ECF subfamily)